MNQRAKLIPKGVVRRLFREARKFFVPFPPVGGLEINDAGLRFLLIREGTFALASLRLPPGIVAGGEVKDQANFIAALRSIRGQVSGAGKFIHAVVLLPPEAVSTQPFTLPDLSEGQRREAVQLNLGMMSPIEVGRVYAGAQALSRDPNPAHQREYLAAFTERRAADIFSSCLRAADFRVVAMEFPGLALVRTVRELGSEAFRSGAYLLVQVSSVGLALMVIKEGNLHFHRYRSWAELARESGGREIGGEALMNFLRDELRRVLNFYGSRWGGSLGNTILMGGALQETLRTMLADEFGCTVQSFTLEGARDLEEAWFPALGAAWRGLIPRGKDDFLNLAAETVETDYREARSASFWNLWQKVVGVALGLVLALFIGADAYLMRREKAIQAELGAIASGNERAEIAAFEAEARAFNDLVRIGLEVDDLSRDWSPFFETLVTLAGEGISLENIAVRSGGATVAGSAVTEVSALAFKNKLLAEEQFADVSLPLSNILARADGSVGFTITFKLKQ